MKNPEIVVNSESYIYLDTPVLVLAGGEGTRLKNKGNEDLDKWPKLLVDIPYRNSEFGLKRATMLDVTLLQIRESGFTNITAVTSTDSDLVNAHLKAFYGPSRIVPINLQIDEGRPKEGTASAVVNAIIRQGLSGTCIVTPADMLFPYKDLENILMQHDKKNSRVTWTVMENPPNDAQNIGKILVDKNGIIREVHEGREIRAELDQQIKACTSGGLLVVDTEYFVRAYKQMIDEMEMYIFKPMDIWRDVISWLVDKGALIHAFCTKEQIHDLGEIERLYNAGEYHEGLQ